MKGKIISILFSHPIFLFLSRNKLKNKTKKKQKERKKGTKALNG